MSELRYNKLNSEADELFHVLTGEMGEALAEIGRVQRHGLDSQFYGGNAPSNKENLEIELGDVLNAIQMLSDKGYISMERILERKKQKRATIEKYLHHFGKEN